MPALTLASAGDVPLVLEIREAADSGAAAVWVERGFIQTSPGDDGISYRARFLLRPLALGFRGSADAGSGSECDAREVYLDEPPRCVNAVMSSSNGERVLRIPLPESKPGRSMVLDIRDRMPAGTDDENHAAAPQPVAAFAGPLRRFITGPSGTLPLVLSGGRTEQRWRPRLRHVRSGAGFQHDDLEKWFQSGSANDSESGSVDAAVVRSTSPETVRIYHVSQLKLVIGCSVGILLLMGLLVSRLPAGAVGPVVALAAGTLAVLAVFYPQLAAQLSAAAEPGLAVLLLVLVWPVRGPLALIAERVTFLPRFLSIATGCG